MPNFHKYFTKVWHTICIHIYTMNKQYYKRKFPKSYQFQKWVEELHTKAMFSFLPNGGKLYELEMLHKHFGTCEPKKLVEIIYNKHYETNN